MKPTKIEFGLGLNIHGQNITLTKTKTSANQEQWILYQDAANQRDESTFITGLTKEQILKMAEAANSVL